MFNFRTISAGVILSLYSIFMMTVPAHHLNLQGLIIALAFYLISVITPVWLWVKRATKRSEAMYRINFTMSSCIISIGVMASFFLFVILRHIGVF